ncbi:MAG TPA: hypothetical protein VGH30_12695 [Jatrophihabitantaceae bacterium]|jgi:hypothetical protein
MRDIEFVPDQPDDELLDNGARRPRPPWLIPVGLAVIVIAAFIVLVNRNSSSTPSAAPSRPAASSTPGPVATAADLPPGNAEGQGSFGEPIDAGANVLDVAVSGDMFWELQPRQILRYNEAGVQARGRLPFVVPDRDELRIVLDLPTDGLWLVITEKRHTRLVEYDVVRLKLLRSLTLDGSASDAAALDGTLYLTVGNDLVRVPEHGQPDRVAHESTSLAAIVTDSARGGLLMADVAAPTHLWRITPHTHGRVHVADPVSEPVIKASLAVANGAIWIAGFAHHGAVLMRLDPTSLKAVARSSLRQRLGPGAVLVAGGVLDVWVRSGGGSQDLHCIDAAGGHPLQRWDISGPVSSGGGTALVATADGAVPLQLSRCSG